MKHWSWNPICPGLTRDYGEFKFTHISIDWSTPGKGWASGHMAMTVIILGFGLSVERRKSPDVYGDGGVA